MVSAGFSRLTQPISALLCAFASVCVFARNLPSNVTTAEVRFGAKTQTLAKTQSAQTPDLGPLIDGLQQKYSRMQGLAADFIQVFAGPDGRVIRETGHLLLKRPRKARWEYASPERKLFVSDGKNVFFYVYGEKNATTSSIKETADHQIPFLFLLGRGNLRKDFTRIEIATGEPSITAGNQVLRLFPKRAPEEFKQLLVEVSPGSFEVRRMVIFERSGARMEFLISNVRENFIAPDTQFQFAAPPGVTLKRAE